jgi:hypothetical protein
MYSFKVLNQEYDELSFFNSEFKYSNDDLDRVINHMIEHIGMFSKENVLLMVQKSENKDKYIEAINNIGSFNEKVKEKDLRDLLFSKTFIPVKQKNKTRKQEGSALFLLSMILYVLFIVIVLLMMDKDIKYQMMNIVLLIPSFILTKGLSKLLLKKDNFIYLIISFMVLYYITTLICSFMCKNYESNVFVEHFLGIINTPIDLFKSLFERMEG